MPSEHRPVARRHPRVGQRYPTISSATMAQVWTYAITAAVRRGDPKRCRTLGTPTSVMTPPLVVAAFRPVGHYRLATDRAGGPCSPPATGAKLTSSVASRPTVGTKPQWWHTLVMSMSLTAGRGPGRPPAAKADETRKRILHAARQVFSERGYDGATFQEIAVRADLTRPAINHYFANKRVLYQEVVEQTHELVIVAGIERARR